MSVVDLFRYSCDIILRAKEARVGLVKLTGFLFENLGRGPEFRLLGTGLRK